VSDGQHDRLLGIAADTRRGVIRLARRLRAERPPEALSANKVGVLGYLYRYGPHTPGEITAAEHQRPQSLTRVFAELEASGLISRTRSQRDGRESVLDLTPPGLESLTRDMAQRDLWLASVIAGLGETEAEVLRLAAAIMERLADAAPADGGPASMPGQPADPQQGNGETGDQHDRLPAAPDVPVRPATGAEPAQG
jgi:DNA-binding MarR family transcriptional regulator